MSATAPFSFFFFRFQKFLKTGCWDDKNKTHPSKNCLEEKGRRKTDLTVSRPPEGRHIETDKQYHFTKPDKMEKELQVPHLFFF